MKVQNPVLPGFNPDPSLLRVGDDYYIATSTFEWFPGVAIYHSKDLVNWKLVDYALKDDKVLDMTGMDAACGVWAPNLTYNNGKFYLCYTVVYTNRKRHKDTYNYLTTAPSIHGPWSKPVFMNCSGFDPSLFHDDDGRKYFVNMTLDYRDGTNRFSGIDVQEYDEVNECMIGEPVRAFPGTWRGMTEGPNIFKHNGYYYCVCAEGGTDKDHCTIVARSENVFGPYVEYPDNPILISTGNDCMLRRAGHSQIIEGADGNWYMSHLCSRPYDGYSIMGRETAIQNMEWTEDGWIRIKNTTNGAPLDDFEVGVEVTQNTDHSLFTDFAAVNEIPLDYMTLRQSAATQGVRIEDGVLRMTGGCSLFCKYKQALLARRQQALDVDFSTAFKFNPRRLNHMAGIQVYYNYDNYMNLRLTRVDGVKMLNVATLDNTVLSDSEWVPVPEEVETISMKLCLRKGDATFYYSFGDAREGADWQRIGTVGDVRKISDEYIEGNGFTGSMIGVSCQDIQGDGVEADFLWIDYKEL